MQASEASQPNGGSTTNQNKAIALLCAVLVVGTALGIVLRLVRPPVQNKLARAGSAEVDPEAVDIADVAVDEDSATFSVAPTKAGPGTLVLRGRLVDTGRQPVAGIQVFAELEPPTVAPGGVPGLATGSGSAPRIGQYTSWRAVAAPTDRDGKFVLDGLVSGRYRLVVRAASIATAEVRQVAVPQDPTKDLQIEVARRVSIAGVVRDGKVGLGQVHVAIRSDAIAGMVETLTGKDGRFEFTDLPEGGYQIWAWRASLVAPTQRVLRKGFLPAGEVTLQLEPGTIVVGKVVDRDDGSGIAAAVELRSTDEREAPRYGHSGLDGAFRIEGVPNGRWIADAYAPGYISDQVIELVSGRGNPELLLSTGAIVAGKVVDAANQPVAGVLVSLEIATESGTRSHSPGTEAAKLARFDGAIAATEPRSKTAVAPAPVTASPRSTSPGFIARGELGVLKPIPPIPPEGTTPAQPSVAAGSGQGSASGSGSASGFVPSPPPSDVAVAQSLRGSWVVAQVLPVDPQRQSAWVTDAKGQFRIRAVPSGKATLIVSAPGYPRLRVIAGDAVAGEVLNKDVTLVMGQRMRGKVVDEAKHGIADALVTVKDNSGAEVARVVTDGAGEYVTPPLTGEVVITAVANLFASATTSEAIAGSGDFIAKDIELVKANAQITGIVEDERGVSLAGATITLIGDDKNRTVSNPDGSFMLPPTKSGTSQVRVVHSLYPAFVSDVQASVANRLRVPLGGGIDGAVLSKLSAAPLPRIKVVATCGTSTAAATTDDRGRFSLRGVSAGDCLVTVAAANYSTWEKRLRLEKASEPTIASLRDFLIELDKSSSIFGVIRNDRGARVANAAVSALRADGSVACSAVSSPVGEFSLRDCPTGELTLRASVERKSVEVAVTLSAGRDLNNVTLEFH